MPNGAESKTTIELIDILKDPEHTLWTAAGIEISDRVIEENDTDADAKHTGGIRPYHLPLVG